MSFKNFSASQDAPGNDKPENKTKTAPRDDRLAAQPREKQDEAAPAQKSAAPAQKSAAPAQKS